MIDLRPIFERHGLAIKEQGRGWLGLNCPWCGDTLFHLGYNSEYGVFHCWRCGKVPTAKTLAALLNMDWRQARMLMARNYSKKDDSDAPRVSNEAFELPSAFGVLREIHREYLRGRGLDDQEVENKWNLMGTYKDDVFGTRIVCPVRFRGRTVSWVARDVTGGSSAKVVACPRGRELLAAKSVLYGYDLAVGNTVVVVEGPFDAMKYGPGAVATLGVSFTLGQVSLLQGYRNVFILFDSVMEDGIESEKDAQAKAMKLADMLSVSCNVWIMDDFRSDPGDMSGRQIERIKNRIEKIKEKSNV